MSRVERTENPSERRSSEESRNAGRGRNSGTPQRDPSAGHTPTKAEGELSDVEEALERQKE
jgi:hypothetical protein